MSDLNSNQPAAWQEKHERWNVTGKQKCLLSTTWKKIKQIVMLVDQCYCGTERKTWRKCGWKYRNLHEMNDAISAHNLFLTSLSFFSRSLVYVKNIWQLFSDGRENLLYMAASLMIGYNVQTLRHHICKSSYVTHDNCHFIGQRHLFIFAQYIKRSSDNISNVTSYFIACLQ